MKGFYLPHQRYFGTIFPLYRPQPYLLINTCELWNKTETWVASKATREADSSKSNMATSHPVIWKEVHWVDNRKSAMTGVSRIEAPAIRNVHRSRVPSGAPALVRKANQAHCNFGMLIKKMPGTHPGIFF